MYRAKAGGLVLSFEGTLALEGDPDPSETNFRATETLAIDVVPESAPEVVEVLEVGPSQALPKRMSGWAYPRHSVVCSTPFALIWSKLPTLSFYTNLG